MTGQRQFRIVVRREFGDRLCAAFDGIPIEIGDGRTVLTATVADDSELHGLLDRLRDFAVELVSLTEIPG